MPASKEIVTDICYIEDGYVKFGIPCDPKLKPHVSLESPDFHIMVDPEDFIYVYELREDRSDNAIPVFFPNWTSFDELGIKHLLPLIKCKVANAFRDLLI